MAETSKKRPTPRKPTKRKDAKEPKQPKQPKLPKQERKAAVKKATARSAATKKVATARASGDGASKPRLSIPHPSASALDPKKALERRKAEKDKKGAVSQPRERRERHQREKTVRLVISIALGIFALLIVGIVAYFALRNSPAFEITKVEFEPTEHVAPEDVENLAQVSAGSTLLNVDTVAIEESLKKNPWVASASFEFEFPNTLRIIIEEQKLDALVLMSSGTVAWYLGEDGAWTEPVMIEAAEGQSVNDAALEIAKKDGCLLITDVPATIEPEAGSVATDASRAPSEENVSCVLDSGVEVSLGEPEEISQKEKIVEAFLEQHKGSVVFINVRMPSNPTFREIASENVQGGDESSSEQTDASTE